MHQRAGRLCLGDRRRPAHPSLPRAPRRRPHASPRPHARRRQARGGRGVRRPDVGAGRQPLGRWHPGAARLPRARALPSRRHHPGVDLRLRRRAARQARVDGAGREHHLRSLRGPPGRRAARADAARARQLSRLPRDDTRRRLGDAGHAGGAGAPRAGLRRRRAPVAAGTGRRGTAGARVVSPLRLAPRARARPRRRGRPPPRRHLPGDAAGGGVAHGRAVDRAGALAGRGGRVGPPPGPRGRPAGALDARLAGRRAGAPVDPPPGAGRRSVRGPAPAGGRAGGHDRHRRLPLVRRLGPRHDDRAARTGPGDRAPRAGRARPAHVRAFRGPRHAAQPVPRRTGRRPSTTPSTRRCGAWRRFGPPTRRPATTVC